MEYYENRLLNIYSVKLQISIIDSILSVTLFTNEGIRIAKKVFKYSFLQTNEY